MWFKRKRKSDPDSALTETLRSLQTLLEDEPPDSGRVEPQLQNPTADDPDTPEMPSELTSLPFEPQPPADNDAAPDAGEPPAVETAQMVFADYDSDLYEEIEIPSTDPHEQAWTDTLEVDDGEAEPPRTQELETAGLHHTPAEPLAEELTGESLDIPSIDTIPVLTNIVYEPGAAGDPATVPESGTASEVNIIDAYVELLAQRLESDGLASMDARQEQSLRDVLVSILIRT